MTSQIPPYALERVQNVRAREFIRVCLSPDPDERPTAMELLDHPFLKDKNEEEVGDTWVICYFKYRLPPDLLNQRERPTSFHSHWREYVLES